MMFLDRLRSIRWNSFFGTKNLKLIRKYQFARVLYWNLGWYRCPLGSQVSLTRWSPRQSPCPTPEENYPVRPRRVGWMHSTLKCCVGPSVSFRPTGAINVLRGVASKFNRFSPEVQGSHGTYRFQFYRTLFICFQYFIWFCFLSSEEKLRLIIII